MKLVIMLSMKLIGITTMWNGIMIILATYFWARAQSGITVLLYHIPLQIPPPKAPTRGNHQTGFVAAPNIIDWDIESNDIVDFDASFEENSTPDNLFINFEAEEATESESEGPFVKVEGDIRVHN